MISTAKAIWWIIILSMVIWVIWNFYWKDEKEKIEKLNQSTLDCMRINMDKFSDEEFNQLTVNGFNRSSIRLYLQSSGQEEGLSDDGIDNLIKQLSYNIESVKQKCKS